MIAGRNIVLKREGNKLILPTFEHKEVDAPITAPYKTFMLCRIVDYKRESGILEVQLCPDVIDHHSKFQISKEANSDALTSLVIRTIIFSVRSRLPLVNHEPWKKFKSFQEKTDKPDRENHYEQVLRERNVLAAKPEEDRHEHTKENTIERRSGEQTIELPVKDLKFCDGKVTFECYVQAVGRKYSFDISHTFLKKEYDSIKNYFPKVLRIDKFSITIRFEYSGMNISEYYCISKHVFAIDDSLFELVEDLYILDHVVNSARDDIASLTDLSLQSAEATGSDNLQDSEWLLSKLITKEKTKHYYHLRYLSDRHQAAIFNLRLTGKPLSFIFLLATQNGYCLIWETYSTEEATYLWKLDKMKDAELNSQVDSLVEKIKWLRANNKKNYLNTKPADFKRIEHEYCGEDMGFKKWKEQVEEFVAS